MRKITLSNYHLESFCAQKFIALIETAALQEFVKTHQVNVDNYFLLDTDREYWRLDYWRPNGPNQDNSLHHVVRHTPEEAANQAYLNFCKARLKGA